MQLAFACVALSLVGAATESVADPKVLDARLKIELFAAEPDIVTPTGLAIDARGRVYVVESHTHFRPEGYVGPPADRIRVFEDTNDDGRADRITTFFEGTTWTMNIGIHPDGSVYVATRDEIFRLRDTDGDGTADERTPIAHLESTGNYPHNGLSGFAFDFASNVYFGLGENLGAEFKLIGTDGSLASELEGGQIYRCRPDGSKLEMVALGFWNPFHLAIDTFGRLFVVDNDPDSLPPCRLMHIVPGGNYGYRYRNGRKGVHPFTAWNGELPGTLPMVTGTGEAPSGIVAYESDHLPEDYSGDLLSTSWGDHRIERSRLEPRGASFRATPESIITGDENFRPVGIAVAPDGSLYVTDWASKEYHVHGKGRVWHISAAKPKAVARPTDPFQAIHSAHRPLREDAARRLAADPVAGQEQLKKLASGDPSPRVRGLAIEALAAAGANDPSLGLDDPSPDVRALAVSLAGDATKFAQIADLLQPSPVRAAALRRISDPAAANLLWDAAIDLDAFIAESAREGLYHAGLVGCSLDLERLNAPQRLAALLILREKRVADGQRLLTQFLVDRDPTVRFAAIQWVGEERLVEFREALHKALAAGPTTGRLFAGYLAALERLDGVQRVPSEEWAGEQYIARALLDPKAPAEVRRWSLRMLRPDHPALDLARLREFLASDDPLLQLEVVRTLRDGRLPEREKLLLEIAGNATLSPNLRAEAVVGLTADEPSAKQLLLALAGGDDRTLRNEALRSLRGASLSPAEQQSLARLETVDAQTAALLRRLLQPTAADSSQPAPADLAGWLKLLDRPVAQGGDDPAAGARIFFHRSSAACSRCHQVAGRGARVGPELTTTAATLSRSRLIESIVRPSKEIAPHFATWLVVTTSGKSFVGMLVKEEATGEQTYADNQGALLVLKPSDIETRKAQTVSIMPEGLPTLMTSQEFRDLLAFLQSAGEAR